MGKKYMQHCARFSKKLIRKQDQMVTMVHAQPKLESEALEVVMQKKSVFLSQYVDMILNCVTLCSRYCNCC